MTNPNQVNDVPPATQSEGVGEALCEPLLINDDCLNVLSSLQGVDLVLCDLPYGITNCSWDKIIPFDKMWTHLSMIAGDRTPIVLTCAQPFTSQLISSNSKMFKYSWVWHKNKATGFLNSKKQPLRNCEDIAVFYKRQPIYNPQKTTGHKPVNSYTKNTSDGPTLGRTQIGFSGGGSTERYPTQVLSFDVVNNDGSREDKLHPTQKPVALMEYLIKTYTSENATVLDFAMGSGSTGVACMNTGRNFIGIEKNRDFFNKAKARILSTSRPERNRESEPKASEATKTLNKER